MVSDARSASDASPREPEQLRIPGIEARFSMAQARLSERQFDPANLRRTLLLFPGFSPWLEL
jgi:hypothetical protein